MDAEEHRRLKVVNLLGAGFILGLVTGAIIIAAGLKFGCPCPCDADKNKELNAAACSSLEQLQQHYQCQPE